MTTSFRIIVNIEYGVVALFLCFRHYRLFITIYKKNTPKNMYIKNPACDILHFVL